MTSRKPRAVSQERFRLEEYLLAVGRIQTVGLHDQDRQEAMDAVNECRHGRLSHDKTPGCGCWRGELAPVLALSVDELIWEDAA